MPSPCLDCGACCAAFRVSFYWAEADDAPGGQVPAELTRKLDPYRRCMTGTDTPAPRCTALAGTVGQAVVCTIYERRPSPCREFEPFDAGGQPNPRCTSARARHGLPPLTPAAAPATMPEAARESAGHPHSQQLPEEA